MRKVSSWVFLATAISAVSPVAILPLQAEMNHSYSHEREVPTANQDAPPALGMILNNFVDGKYLDYFKKIGKEEVGRRRALALGAEYVTGSGVAREDKKKNMGRLTVRIAIELYILEHPDKWEQMAPEDIIAGARSELFKDRSIFRGKDKLFYREFDRIIDEMRAKEPRFINYIGKSLQDIIDQ